MRGLALGLLLFFVWQSLSASAQSQVQIGIDVVSDGNGNLGVNSVDYCTSVSSGDSIDIDIYVRNVTELVAWEAYLHFQEDKLAFVSADPKLFLQNEPGSKLLTLSDPDAGGRHFIGAADSSAAAESGSGVLARVTLKATAPGLASLDLPTRDVDGDGQFEEGPRLTTRGGGHPGDTNGDGVFDGPVAPAFIAIDRSCSGVPAPAPDPRSDDDNPQPEATTPASSGDDGGSGNNGSGSSADGNEPDGDSVLAGGGSNGSTGDEPPSDDNRTDSNGSADGGSGAAGAAQDGTSDGLSDALFIAIAVAGAAVVAGSAVFGLRRLWSRPN
jgi:hypothetical protein